MTPEEIIRKILEAGAQAPSGSNSQPWRFEVKDGIVSVFMTPEKDHAILNFRNRGTILANGTLIENMVIAARHYGFEPSVEMFPDPARPNLVANIRFEKGSKNEEKQLFEAIGKRATNRKPFETKKIDGKIIGEFIASSTEIGENNVSIKITEDKKNIQMLAKSASTNESVMFADRQLHKLFFEELVWTKEEENEKKSGLYMKTMELKPPQEAALRLFQYWGFMNIVNKLGAARGIAQGNAKGYAACGLYGAVLCDDNDKDFLGVGRVIERIWLKATAAGLSFHLQTGVNFLYQRIAAGDGDIFSQKHRDLISEQYMVAADLLGAGSRFIPALFRIGYDGEPSARSSKRAPEVTFK